MGLSCVEVIDTGVKVEWIRLDCMECDCVAVSFVKQNLQRNGFFVPRTVIRRKS